MSIFSWHFGTNFYFVIKNAIELNCGCSLNGQKKGGKCEHFYVENCSCIYSP